MRDLMKKYGQLPIVSGVLVLINIIVFAVCNFDGGRLYAAGSLSLLETYFFREYGRIFSAMFLHSSVNHLFNNMLVLFFMGAMIEKEIGHFSFLFLYLISGIGGNVLSLVSKAASNDYWSVSIGASGAVFGLDGVLLALVLFWGRRTETVTPVRVILMIALSLYSGFSGANIDNAAHVGGLVTGFVAGTIVCVVRKRMGKSQEV